MRTKDRTGRAHLLVEAVPRNRGRLRVEDDGDLVARGVLELLHHQLAAACGRPPVHFSQRLALLVLAHRVQVEARRPPQQQPPSVLRVRAALGEEPVERDEPRIDEQGAAGGEIDLRVRQPEGVVDHRLRLLDHVAPSRHPLEHVRAPVGAEGSLERRVPLAELRNPLRHRDRGQRHARLRPRLERHPDVLALEEMAAARAPAEEPAADAAAERDRPARQAGPRCARRAVPARAPSRRDRAPSRRRATRPRRSQHPAAASARHAWSCARPGPGSAPRLRRRSPPP